MFSSCQVLSAFFDVVGTRDIVPISVAMECPLPSKFVNCSLEDVYLIAKEAKYNTLDSIELYRVFSRTIVLLEDGLINLDESVELISTK